MSTCVDYRNMEVSIPTLPIPALSGVTLITCIRHFKIVFISRRLLTPVVYSSHSSQSDLFEKHAANHIIPCSDFQRASIILIVKALFCPCESPAHLPYLSSSTGLSCLPSQDLCCLSNWPRISLPRGWRMLP